jgi:hypothetical protein
MFAGGEAAWQENQFIPIQVAIADADLKLTKPSNML